MFYDLDSFGCNARHTMQALNTLADLGISIWDYSTGHAVDLDSFEGEMMTFMKARFAQQYRDSVRKHTKTAMRQKAEAGFVTGGTVFGYDNVRQAKGQTTRTINEREAAVVRDIYTRAAAGEGLRTIAAALNRAGALITPRATGTPERLVVVDRAGRARPAALSGRNGLRQDGEALRSRAGRADHAREGADGDARNDVDAALR